MKVILLAAIASIATGIAILGYDHFSYTTTEKVLQIGPITATAQQTHDVTIPPVFGWVLIGIGAAALVYGVSSRKG